MEQSVVVVVLGERYRAVPDDDGWQLYRLDGEGQLLWPALPAAFAMTAGEAWVRGVASAADLPIDELVIVAADQDGQLSRRLLSAVSPPELLS